MKRIVEVAKENGAVNIKQIKELKSFYAVIYIDENDDKNTMFINKEVEMKDV